MRYLCVPWREVGLRQLEDTEATVLLLRAVEIKLTPILLVELIDDAADAFLADVSDGLRSCFWLWQRLR